jgi:hypothetical protein
MKRDEEDLPFYDTTDRGAWHRLSIDNQPGSRQLKYNGSSDYITGS